MKESFSKSRSQILSINPLFPVRPLLSVSSLEFEEIWKEVKWDTKKVNLVLDLYSKFCREEYFCENDNLNNSNNNIQLMSSQRLVSLLKSIAIIGTEGKNIKDIDFFSRNDLCSIMTGIPFIDKKNFMRLICLLERSTPHTTTSPAGICRLKLVFAYYDWGWKGYLDGSDWKRLRSDILTSTYYGKLFNKEYNKSTVISSSSLGNRSNSPVPETLEEGIEQLNSEMSMRSMRNNNIKIIKDNEEFNEIPSMLPNQQIIVDFPLFVKFVEYRVIKGTSQILRIELPVKDQEESISYSIKYNCGSIFLDNNKESDIRLSKSRHLGDDKFVSGKSSNINTSGKSLKSPSNNGTTLSEVGVPNKGRHDINSQIKELDEEINSLKASLGNIYLDENNIDKSPKDANESTTNRNNELINSIFSQPIENFDGIFLEKNETQKVDVKNDTDNNNRDDIPLSSIVIPTSSTPIRKSRSFRTNLLLSGGINEQNTGSVVDSDVNQNSKDRITPNSANKSVEFGSPPVLI
ncbi:hypothetical protein FG386_001680 [Cryptosporidium ryanae]|uniref:uncharacterized protein n=1 Tax=Cryptosporidium ryanae TaxID=515981 RepID=UPI00351A8577|nr:hypothetical protein FG386_001680 [Cryptosporidium ryanae]